MSLLIIFVVELAVGIAAAVFKNDFQVALKDTLRMSMTNYDKSEGDKMAWENVQRKLQCCGVDGPADWHSQEVTSARDGQKMMPSSCCHPTRDGAAPPTDAQCSKGLPTDIYVYQDGCYPKLQEKVDQGAKVLIGVGIGIAFIEVRIHIICM